MQKFKRVFEPRRAAPCCCTQISCEDGRCYFRHTPPCWQMETSLQQARTHNHVVSHAYRVACTVVWYRGGGSDWRLLTFRNNLIFQKNTNVWWMLDVSRWQMNQGCTWWCRRRVKTTERTQPVWHLLSWGANALSVRSSDACSQMWSSRWLNKLKHIVKQQLNLTTHIPFSFFWVLTKCACGSIVNLM